VVNEARLALDSAISEFTYFLTVKALPLFSVELFKKFQYKKVINKIDECVSNIAFVL
jgi:hypothetical protein